MSVTDSGDGAIRFGGYSDLSLTSVFPIIIGDRALFRTDINEDPCPILGPRTNVLCGSLPGKLHSNIGLNPHHSSWLTPILRPRKKASKICSSYQPHPKMAAQQWSSACPMSRHLDLTRISNWRDDNTYLEVNVNGVTVLMRKGNYTNIWN